MINGVIATVLAAVVGCAVRYLYKEKKSGKACVGCPYSQACHSQLCDGAKPEKTPKEMVDKPYTT